MSYHFHHLLFVSIILSIMTLGVLSCGKTEDEVKTSSSDNQTTNLCNPTCSGLVAHYTFNGNSLNSASENYHASTKDNSTQPSLVSDRNGKPYSSYQFDGIDDYLYVDNVSDFASSAYDKVSNFAGDAYEFGKDAYNTVSNTISDAPSEFSFFDDNNFVKSTVPAERVSGCII